MQGIGFASFNGGLGVNFVAMRTQVRPHLSMSSALAFEYPCNCVIGAYKSFIDTSKSKLAASFCIDGVLP